MYGLDQHITGNYGEDQYADAEGGEYGSCPVCGAEVYSDGGHVLDPYDRESNGYPISVCRDMPEPIEPTDEDAYHARDTEA